MEKSTINKLRDVQLSIFDFFINFCNKNNLQYYIIGGTLLGSIRHGGYIPWDDDIDIGMPREDYDNFIFLFLKERNELYYLQNKVTDYRVHIPFSKLRRNHTTILEEETKNLTSHKGIFIDVFPLDKLPFNDTTRQKFKYFLFRLFQSIHLYKNKYRSFKNPIVKIISFLLSFLPYQLLNFFTIKLMTSYGTSSTDYVVNYSSLFIYKKQKLSLSQVYGSGKLVKFEHLYVNAPTNYDFYLKTHYGDYLKMPPIEKRISHHKILSISFDE